ncbi:hypothetical protein [Streptococcus pacificus]|uniref:Niacin transporter NiaX n=1 Tax=Streptococcus pacificus TaxID=2740577 RepID=A0ABS0ZGD1_9STRE|nr:hypothetical protein [Streptococcus pacificus]MBJ8325070.1 hypothetical protein [Streptococcus pacificus]
MALSALLTAFAIAIPIVMPAKIIIGPASFTLASHVPIFIAMFISPSIAIFVSLGSTLGFFMAGFPIVIVFRALSHVIFASIGAILIKKRIVIFAKPFTTFLFAIIINLIHGLAEFLVVIVMTTGSQVETNYWFTMLWLVGFGTLIHGTIDFYLARICWHFMTKKKI